MSDVNAFYRGKRVLVTGGLGFIGSNLSIRLVEAGADVLIVDSMLPAYGASLDNISEVADRLTVDISDVRDPNSLRTLVRDRDFVFSLAGQVSHIESMQDPMTDLEINCKSQLSLLECCRRDNPSAKIVFASTRQLYGRPQYLPVDERHPLAPVDVNGIHKLAAERYYTLYRDVYGIDTVSLRLTNTYGPRMDLESVLKGFVGVFVRRALLGERIELYGTGEQKRDFNFVDDVVDALLLAGQSPAVAGQVYNLGHSEPVSLRSFVETLAELVPLEFTCVEFPPDAAIIDIGDYYGDFTKFREATGWSPRVALREGLERTLAYHADRLPVRA